jgi:peroxiredoxin
MKILLPILVSLIFSGPAFSEEDIQLDNRTVCEITTRRFDQDIERCKKGDILSIFVNGGNGFDVPNAIARACNIQKNDTIITLGQGKSFAVCIYRGKLREHKDRRGL